MLHPTLGMFGFTQALRRLGKLAPDWDALDEVRAQEEEEEAETERVRKNVQCECCARPSPTGKRGGVRCLARLPPPISVPSRVLHTTCHDRA